MRRHLMLALASSASLSLLVAAGCSSSDDAANPPGSDAGASPDGTPGVPDDASAPDATGPKPDAGPHEPGWDPSFSLPGVAGRLKPAVNAVARIANRQIALAGNFEQAGSIPTQFVALWNGDKWLSISTGLTGAIDKMVATPTGELMATVRSNSDGSTKLFKWNKMTWSEVASFDDRVTAIDVAPDGTFYAAGFFTTIGAQSIARLAKLTGNTWSAVADAPEGTEVVRVVGSKLCIGGRFDPFSGGAGVRCLEGGGWQNKGFGPDASGSISDIGEQNGDLVIAGQFALDFENGSSGSLARWDGTKWGLIGGGLEGVGNANVMDMEIVGDKIYVAGDIRFAGGLQVSHVAMWDVTQVRWSTLNDGIFGDSGGFGISQPPAEVLAVDQGGEVYVGGRFALIGGRNALGIARWDGNQWNPVDDPKAKRLGLNGGVNSMAEAPNGALYVGGTFLFAGGDVAASGVARFENEAWSPLGAGLNGAVMALAVSGTTVYAGGSFTRSGPAVARNIAQWNGATWSSIGGGVDAQVSAIVLGPDGNLYAGGDFTEAGGIKVNHVARWDGKAWSALGGGFDGSVRALAFDAAGKLYAGGSYTKSGETEVKNIAVWTGTSWAGVGAGVDLESGGAVVSGIVVYDGKLTIGGYFDRSGTTTVESLAAWNGTAWEPVGGGVRRGVGDLASVQGLSARGKELYVVGGGIEQAGPATDGGSSATFQHIAMWNGATWSNLGAGLADTGSVIVASKDNFWVGGGFTFAGDQGSYNIGRFFYGK